MTKALVVTGTFNELQGKPSSIGDTLCVGLSNYFDVTSVNGGPLSTLDSLTKQLIDYSVIIWMPNIDNSVDKYLSRIKAIHQKCLLVSSKRVVEKNYSEWDVVGRLLKTKSNLGIMITQDDKFRFKLLDPLANIWVDTQDVLELAGALGDRLYALGKITRLPSVRLADQPKKFEVPSDYLEAVHWYGNKFYEYVNAMNPNRFLGNTVTRCMKSFPIARESNRYLISRRNVAKDNITAQDFVEVTPEESRVEYFGLNKPSVDSPIQVRLLNYYSNINYIIHGHVYAPGQLMTSHCLPCGAIEEFEEIKQLVPDRNVEHFVVNLRGHGCLILANKVEQLYNVTLESRPCPEVQEVT